MDLGKLDWSQHWANVGNLVIFLFYLYFVHSWSAGQDYSSTLKRGVLKYQIESVKVEKS